METNQTCGSDLCCARCGHAKRRMAGQSIAISGGNPNERRHNHCGPHRPHVPYLHPLAPLDDRISWLHVLDSLKRHMVQNHVPKGPSGSGSVVEHLLAKEGVASSNLVFRSIFLWRRGQVVKAGVCKTPIVGSIPTVASTSRRKDVPPLVRCY